MTTPMTWQAELALAEARLADLDIADEVRERALSVAEWRDAVTESTFYLPIPLMARERPTATGRWSTTDAGTDFVDRVGLDDQGRPVVVLQGPRLTADRPRYAWRYDGDDFAIEEIDFRKRSVRRQSYLVDAVASSVAVSSAAGGLHDVRSLRWNGPQLRRVEGARQVPGRTPAAFAREARLNHHGRLELILSETELPDFAQPPSPSALADALRRAAHLRPTAILWDGRVEDQEPWPADSPAFARPLAAALHKALVAALPSNRDERLAWLDIRFPYGKHDSRPLPPVARTIDTGLVDALLRSGSRGLDVIDDAWISDDGEGAATLSLIERLDSTSLRMCRSISTALDGNAPQGESREARALLEDVADQLAGLMTDPAHTPHIPLVLVRHEETTGASSSITEALDRARRTSGVDAVARLIAKIRA
ncbi:MAG: hypothetical protein JWQ18_3578 [Conexibacter sp.]|nr:hypothetical protein [Conexibacter sp.]